MTEKERFRATLLDEGSSDRFPYFDLEPADETVARWRREGLPADRSVADYFGLERHRTVGPMLRSYPFYKGAPDLLRDPYAFARRYDPDEPSRYSSDFVERAQRLTREGRVLYVDAWAGGFLQLLGVCDWPSMEAAMFALVEDPARIDELVDQTSDFYCVCLERVLSRVRVDYATFYEPIASNKGPVISPRMFCRFVLPGYRKVLALLERHGVELRFFCTTGGDLGALLEPLIDAGINGLWISNIRSAGMEYAKLRQRWPGVALIGGLDARALLVSDDEVRRVIEETAPVLLQTGRYLPCLDDRPRPNVPFARYQLFRQLLADLAAKG